MHMNRKERRGLSLNFFPSSFEVSFLLYRVILHLIQFKGNKLVGPKSEKSPFIPVVMMVSIAFTLCNLYYYNIIFLIMMMII